MIWQILSMSIFILNNKLIYRNFQFAISYREVKVELGDEVVARDIFFKRNGRVVYVPGISPLNTEFEYGGLKWIGIRFNKDSISTAVIDLKTGEVDKSVKFVKRNKKDINELKPNFRFR